MQVLTVNPHSSLEVKMIKTQINRELQKKKMTVPFLVGGQLPSGEKHTFNSEYSLQNYSHLGSLCQKYCHAVLNMCTFAHLHFMLLIIKIP